MSRRTLHRPVGLRELELIADSGWRRFPPRLAWQPIFYPVFNEAYAAQIASEWNTQDAFSGYLGAVTIFELDDSYSSKFITQNVGGPGHDELWVPAEELEYFNDQIQGAIRLVKVFFGKNFVMPQSSLVATELRRFIHEQVQ